MTIAGMMVAAMMRARAHQESFSRTQSGARSHVAHSNTSGIGATAHSQLRCIIGRTNKIQKQSTPDSSTPATAANSPLRMSIEQSCPAAYDVAIHAGASIQSAKLTLTSSLEIAAVA